MTELDQVWSQMLAQAAVKAGETGRHDVADYLRLKATNDSIRENGTLWLFDTVIEIAGRGVRDGVNLTIEREAPHNFARGSSNMVGSLVRLRHGVRCMTVEAGWARTPSDGIMQNGALAFGRITHFGMPKQNAELCLVHSQTLPNWVDETDKIVDTEAFHRHFAIFLGREL